MSIKLLSKNVINQISAGEVVEKPASIVKELVENSIDAGATNISVDIRGGGIEYISVADNGCGIKANEVKLAFTPHATSKLQEIDDLNSLTTMGFRGEALATISAVSKVTMITKTNEQDTGVCIKLEGGEITQENEIATIVGTKIEASNVFYNTPARLKFLRKPKTEENDITNYIEKLILANDKINFKYTVDGKLIYNTSSCSIIDNIYTIYGKELANNMLEVDYGINGYKVYGYISKPEYSKMNRSYQSLFVNGRFCNNPLVSTAVGNAYENFTMKGKFPAYVLYLTLPQNEVDVNVHPNKLEVKFSDTQKIFRVFNDAVFKALSDFNHIRTVTDNFDNESNIVSNKENSKLNILKENEGISFANNNDLANKLDDYSQYIQSNKNNNSTGSLDFRLTNNILPQVDISNDSNNNEITLNDNNDFQTFEKANNSQTFNQAIATNLNVNQKNVQEDFKDILKLNYKLIGVAFDTYLILEFKDNLYLLDQHAAHERQKYDEIIKQLNDNSLKIQDLMLPYILKVSQNEATFLNDNLTLLNSFGIDICEFGYNTFKITSVPLLIADMNLDTFFNEVFENLNSFAKTPQETIKARFMQMACKSAVKGGDKLSENEINALLSRLETETEVLLCPHGRPIVVEITKKQIEKWFKRIV